MRLFQAKALSCLLKCRKRKLEEKKSKTPEWDRATRWEINEGIRQITHKKMCMKYSKPEPELDVFDEI